MDKYENILKFLHNITNLLNEFIEINDKNLVADNALSMTNYQINSSFINISTLLTLYNSLPIFIGEVFNNLITNPIFKNSDIINKLIRSKCKPKYLNYCEELVPSKPKIYTYFSKIESIKSDEVINQKKGINNLLISLHKPKYIIPNGFRIIVNIIKNKSRLLIPLNQLETKEILDKLLFFDEGKEILFDLTLNQISDEELFAGVPNDAVETLLKDNGYTCTLDTSNGTDAIMAEATGIKTAKRKKQKKKLKKKKTQLYPKKHARHRTQRRPKIGRK